MMNTGISRFCALAALACLPLTGCASTPAPPPSTGFLSSYAQLAPDGQHTLRYIGSTMRNYHSFIVEPVAIYHHQSGASSDVSQEDLQEVAIYARGSLIEALKDRYTVVDAPGPGVARIRMAITDITKSSVALNVLPTTRITGMGLGGASMEGEIVDAQTGEQLAALVESRLANRLNLVAGWSEFGDAQAVIDFWSKRLRERLDEAHD